MVEILPDGLGFAGLYADFNEKTEDRRDCSECRRAVFAKAQEQSFVSHHCGYAESEDGR